jgi:hypothetical protein
MRQRLLLKWLLIVSLLAAAIILGLVGSSPPKTPLAELKSIDELKSRFNQDRGMPRLVLLISPT